MKNSIIVKFIAVFLCAATLFTLAAGGLGLVLLGVAGVSGEKSIAQLKEEAASQRLNYIAREVLKNWASNALGGVPAEITDSLTDQAVEYFYSPDQIHYAINDSTGTQVYSSHTDESGKAYPYRFRSIPYEKLWDPGSETAVLTEDAAEEDATEAAVPENVYNSWVFNEDNGQYYEYRYTPETAYGYSITLYVDPAAQRNDPIWSLMELVYSWKDTLIILSAVSALILAVSVVYLCCAAGRRPGTDEVKAAGLNAFPLDLYALILAGYALACILIIDDIGRTMLEQSMEVTLACAGVAGFLGCLLTVGFCFAFVAQLKTAPGHWWRNSLCGRAALLCLRLAKSLLRLLPKCFQLLKQVLNAVFTVAAWLYSLAQHMLTRLWKAIRSSSRWVSKRCERFLAKLPLTWQWLVFGGVIITVLCLCFQGPAIGGRLQSVLLGVLLCIALVVYIAGAFGTLLEAVQKMRSGDLEAKIDDKFLVGCFKDFSAELNGLADVAMIAAQKQLKSERMKTELITNVSHDIKTPLTSIINYVDLLAKPHTQEEEKAYLEVLSRQSARMKKLIEDLIEMNKATTGNIPVEITTVDAAEAVNQALGEFSDKLEAAGLIPVFHQPEDGMLIRADGRLFWRAMSNVLSNAVKYALPGTRLYVDVQRAEDRVMISMKNISRAELNVTADELLERFVRGDTSRNTEGSGLGLNIAQSLMELQKGQLNLLVDGDLFKVTLVFPSA